MYATLRSSTVRPAALGGQDLRPRAVPPVPHEGSPVPGALAATVVVGAGLVVGSRLLRRT
jgi:hypothetical protein